MEYRRRSITFLRFSIAAVGATIDRPLVLVCDAGRASNARPYGGQAVHEQCRLSHGRGGGCVRIIACAETISPRERSSLSKMAYFLPKIQFLQQELEAGRRNVSSQAGDKTKIQGTLSSPPALHRQGDKGPNRAQPDQKGRDASGASSGAEALIAAPYLLNYECFRNQDLSAKGAPL